MINVNIVLEPDSGIKGFIITGHAGFSEYGKDIVCAAVAAVAQTAVIGLQHYFGSAVKFEQSRGRLSCSLPHLRPEEKEISQAILKTMYWGLRAIEEQYGDYICLTIEGGVLE